MNYYNKQKCEFILPSIFPDSFYLKKFHSYYLNGCSHCRITIQINKKRVFLKLLNTLIKLHE